MLNLVGNLEFWNYSFWNLYRALNICHGMIHRLSMMQLHAELLIIKYVSVFRDQIKVNFSKNFPKTQKNVKNWVTRSRFNQFLAKFYITQRLVRLKVIWRMNNQKANLARLNSEDFSNFFLC